jgi:hypothetical protein
MATVYCGAEPPQPGQKAAALEQLSLSPSNPQIAQDTGLQFKVAGLYGNGHHRDLTSTVAFSVLSPDGKQFPMSQDGLLQVGAPGRYTVSAELNGRTVTTSLNVTAATLTGVALSPSEPQLAKGLSLQFTATAQFSDGTTQNVTSLSSWSEKDTVGSGVAQLSSKGVATAKNVGQASVTVHYKTFSASTTLQVVAATLTALSLSPQNPSLVVGNSLTFSAKGTYSDGTVQDVTAAADWGVEDLMGSGVASIEDSTVTAESAGQATVSVYYQGLEADTTLTVTVVSLVYIAITPLNPTVTKGTTQQFTAAGTYSDGSTQDLTTMVSWTATDISPSKGVASITAAGLATANQAGESVITASYLGLTESTLLTVPAVTLTSLSISPLNPTLTLGASQQFAATGTYSDGTNKVLTTAATWTAKDIAPATGVATITDTGLASANNAGQSTITASYLGLSASTTLTVSSAAGSWVFQTSGTTNSLSGVWGSDPNNVWAVGGDDVSVSTILYWNGTTWTPQTSGSTSYLYAVWGTAANNVWVVGFNGTILHFNGTAWSTQTSGTTNDLLGVWGSGPSNVWAVGDNGTILHYDGTAWSSQTSGTTNLLLGIWGHDTSNVWTVGASGTILKWNGTAWTPQTSGTTAELGAVGGVDVNDVWAVGNTGVILKWNGTTWSPESCPLADNLWGVWGSAANNVWAVGWTGGDMLHWDGTSWTSQPTPTATNFTFVWGLDANNVWAIGWSGTILRWQP